MSKEEIKSDDLIVKEALSKINKDYGLGTIMDFSKQKTLELERISTNLPSLDLILGGGMPKGRIIEVFGKEGSSKTTLALHILAQCQREGKRVAYIDMESAINPIYAQKLGIDMDKLLFSQPCNGNQALQITRDLVETGLMSVVVIDSVANLVPVSDTEKTFDSLSTIGGRARLLSQALPILAISANRTGTIILFINQIRDNINVTYGHGPSYTTPGGKALKFNASIRLQLLAGQAENRLGKDGCEIKVRVKKNKTSMPFRETKLFLFYGEGYDYYSDLVNTAIAYDFIKKGGAWYEYKDIKAQGLVKLVEQLKLKEDYIKEITEFIQKKAKELN